MIKSAYKTVGSRDLTGGISDALNNTFNMFNNIEQQKLDREKLAKQDTRQAVLDKQNKQLFDVKMQEVDRLNKERSGKELLASELMKLPTQKSSTQVVSPAVTQADVEEVRRGLLDTQYDVGTKYKDAFDRLSGETLSKPIPGQFKEVSNYEVVNVPGSQSQKYVDSQTGESLTFSPDSAIGKLAYGDKYFKKEVPIEGTSDVPKYTPNQIHDLALKESGYSEDIGVAEDKLPKLSKEVTKEAMKNLSGIEIKQGKMDLVRRLASEGSIPSELALEVANKINAPKSKKGELDELKYLLNVKEEARKDKELEAKIKSGYFGKSSGQGFSLGEELYTAAGPDGLDAASKYMAANKNSLDSMSTGDKKELLAYLTAKYGHEDDWFTLTGWGDLK